PRPVPEQWQAGRQPPGRASITRRARAISWGEGIEVSAAGGVLAASPVVQVCSALIGERVNDDEQRHRGRVQEMGDHLSFLGSLGGCLSMTSGIAARSFAMTSASL